MNAPPPGPIVALARALEVAALRLEDELSAAQRAATVREIDDALGCCEAFLSAGEMRGVHLWRRALGARDDLNRLMERPRENGALGLGAAGLLRVGCAAPGPTRRRVEAVMGAFVELEEAIRCIAARAPGAGGPGSDLSPEEGDAFGHAVDVIVPALSGRGARVLPFEPGFEDDAVRGAARRNGVATGIVAIPILFVLDEADVPAVVEGPAPLVVAVLEEARARGTRPELRPELLRRAAVPPHALPVDLVERLSTGGRR